MPVMMKKGMPFSVVKPNIMPETDSTWGVEGWGVPPDIEVVEDPAQMQDGRDPQLIAGVEHLLAELEAHPPTTPQRPPYPDRTGMGIPDEER